MLMPFIIIAAIIIFVFIIRLFGAWMLRINELIKLEKQILRELQIANEFSNAANLENKKEV